jgi:hypothetical protein
MPREQITFDVTPELTLEDGTVTIERARPRDGLHVTWHKGPGDPLNMPGWVQVSLEATREADGDIAETRYVFSEPLSAEDIDRLIAVLKLAKRKAYGRTPVAVVVATR